MHVPSRPSGQPCLDLGVLVTTVIVHDAVHVEFGRNRRVYFTQELQKLLVPVTRLAGGQYCAIKHIQGGEQRGGAVTDIVVRDTLPRSRSPSAAWAVCARAPDLFSSTHSTSAFSGGLRYRPTYVAQFLDDIDGTGDTACPWAYCGTKPADIS